MAYGLFSAVSFEWHCSTKMKAASSIGIKGVEVEEERENTRPCAERMGHTCTNQGAATLTPISVNGGPGVSFTFD